MDPILGQLIQVPWGWDMRGWMQCDGRLLSVNSNQALYSLIGTSFGGDGMHNFAIPDYRPIENGVKRPWHSHGEVVTYIATEGIYPSRE